MYTSLLISAAIGFFAGGIVGSKVDQYKRDESGQGSKFGLILGPIIAVAIVVLLN